MQWLPNYNAQIRLTALQSFSDRMRLNYWTILRKRFPRIICNFLARTLSTAFGRSPIGLAAVLRSLQTSV